MRSTFERYIPALFAAAVAAAGCNTGVPETDAEEGDGAESAVSSAEQALGGRPSPAAPCPACAPPFVERRGEREFSGQLIVRPVQGMSPLRDKKARARIAADVAKHYPEVDEYVIRVPSGGARGESENRVAASLMATGDYEYAVPNWTVFPLAVPNDPQYPNQWHHAVMQSPLAWDVQKGSSSMILAFTDTGIDKTHPDLASRRVPGFNSASDLAEAAGGDVADINGHGTHVSGCAAAIGNNGVGVSGVGWNFKIMMVRVTNLPTGNAYFDDITQGARWAADNGAKVVSSSYAGVDSPSIQTTGAYIKARNALYLYAAGNDSRNLSGFDHADVIVVGASDASDQRAYFSAYGRAVDVFAPGVNILSTTNGGGYGNMSGTSMATPVTNGAVGMIWSVDPLFTPAQVEGFLFSSATDLGAPGNDATYGWGRVNVAQGVSAARAVACSHTKCSEGSRLGSGCESCTTDICDLDPFCCDTQWDQVCVQEVMMVCGVSCN